MKDDETIFLKFALVFLVIGIIGLAYDYGRNFTVFQHLFSIEGFVEFLGFVEAIGLVCGFVIISVINWKENIEDRLERLEVKGAKQK